MARDQAVDEVRRHLAPEQRPVAMIVRGLRHEGASQIEERFVIAAQTLDQLRFGHRLFHGRERELGRIDRDDDRIDALVRIGGTVNSSRTDRQRARRRLMGEDPIGHAAFDAHG